MVGKGSMNASRLLGVWGIFSILWATLYFQVFALNPQEWSSGACCPTSSPPPLLIVGGTISGSSAGFRNDAGKFMRRLIVMPCFQSRRHRLI